ncbi:putative papain-like cysteine peptidase superfamily [Helianthus anomalus]
MKDLQPSKWINAGVVNCFASMLNHDENERTNEANTFGEADKIKGTSRNCFTILNMESPIHLINDDDFFNKTTRYKVKDVFTKYMKLVNHPNYRQIENAVPQTLDFEWKMVGNTVDCGVFVVPHMETWFRVTVDKWDSGFPLESGPKKATLTRLRKKYAVK